MSTESRLGRELLKQVSRSFYLTLRLLPSGFREPMSVGYLLARATDTVADTEQVPVAERQAALAQMREVILGHGDLAELELNLKNSFASRQEHDGEKELLVRFGECLDALHAQNEDLQAHTRELLEKIIKGQSDDLVRFAARDDGRVDCFRNDAELERYTYLVAGCVGEFWTQVGLQVDRGFPDEQEGELMRLGKNYGQGLQLINILRDVAADLKKGRCYLPDEEGTIVPDDTDALLDKIKSRTQVCRKLLLDGVRYTSCIRGIRLRVATGLPALIGLRTLDLIDEAPWELHEGGVKIQRKEVKRLLRRALWMSLKPRGWLAFLKRRA